MTKPKSSVTRSRKRTDLTDFAVQFRYDYPAPTEGLNRAEVLSKIEMLWKHVERLVRDTRS